jgi:hypothetical protein
MDTPFDKSYVLRITAKHMRRVIDKSIRITFKRLPEFAADPVKSKEVFETLGFLHRMRNDLDEFQKQYSDQFRSN